MTSPTPEVPAVLWRGLQVLTGLIACLVFTQGCAAQESDTVTRTGQRELAGDEEGFIGGRSLTRIPPQERQPAPVISGPALAGTGTVSTLTTPAR